MVTRVDNGISGGETFRLYGEGFDENTEVYVSEITSADISEAIPDGAEKCEIIERRNNCVTAKLIDKNMSCNMYVTNKYGTSNVIGLNVANPEWVSDKTLAQGDVFSVNGKNMASYAFGKDTKSGVSFVNKSGVSFDIPIISVNPYSIKCKVPEIPAGQYTIYATNDGLIWNKVNDGREIQVLKDVYDPYRIGAALAENYNFNKIINMGEWPYTIKENSDITLTLQGAIDKAALNGGGIVYIPTGKYVISSIILKEGVVIAGSGQKKTILSCIGGTDYVISSNGNNNTGILNMSIVLPDEKPLPDVFVYLGKEFDKNYVKDKSIQNGFIKNVTMKSKMSYDPESDGRGLGILIGGKSKFLIENCEFEGSAMTVTGSYVSEYTKILNNKFITAVCNISVIGEYVTITNNYIERKADEFYRDMNTQGIFMRGYAYVADNTFKNLKNEGGNDGEIICTENYMGGLKLDGKITKASEKSVNVITEDTSDWTLDEVYYGSSYLVITDGRGIGQYSRITSFNKETSQIELETPFKILPNEDSKFIVAPMSSNVIIFNNVCSSSEKGYWLYGDNIDCVIANNTGINTEGIYLRGIYKNTASDKRKAIGYFVDIKNNHFIGGSENSGVCGIGAAINIESEGPKMAYIYGVNIKGNSIDNIIKNTEKTEASEAPHLNGIYIVYDVSAKQGENYSVIRQILIENNKINNCDTGISITPFGRPNENNRKSYAVGDMTEGVQMINNIFKNVENEINDRRDYKYSK